jgi:hypothetical protein
MFSPIGTPRITADPVFCSRFSTPTGDLNYVVNSTAVIDQNSSSVIFQRFGIDTTRYWSTCRNFEHGSVSSDDRIMSEISARGPVSCGINAEPLEDYTGGILVNYRGGVNHVIQIAGWGTESGTKYWIGRNSWGTYWGEHGWFRIIRGGSYDPGCHWAVPGTEGF